MKALVVLLFAVCYVQCRKTYPPIDKNANLAFINMEGGPGVRPGGPPANPPAKPIVPTPPAPVKPGSPPASPPVTTKPVNAPTAAPVTQKAVVTPPTPAKPVATPSQIKPVPVNPKPVATPITTPGPGTVKQLVNFYDSQGKASPIRPYSYSQAVKQG